MFAAAASSQLCWAAITVAAVAIVLAIWAIAVPYRDNQKLWHAIRQWLSADSPFAPAGAKREDGTSLIAFLATFGIAQVAGLLTLIREQESQKYLVLAIYVVLSLATIASVALVIRLRSSETPANAAVVEEGGPLPPPIPYYDRKTIAFGRLMLVWFYPLTALLFVLGIYDLLPGQTYRETYASEVGFKPPVHVTSSNDLDTLFVGRTLGGNQTGLNSWYAWMMPNDGSELVAYLQDPPFDKPYKTFTRELVVSGGLELTDKVAFCFKNLGSAASFEPAYRELRFETEEIHQAAHSSNRLVVDNPNKDEQILILLKVKRGSGAASSSYAIQLGKVTK